MTSRLKSGLFVIAFVTIDLFGLRASLAQDAGVTGNPDTVLVTPSGERLDFIPADAEVFVRVNANGRRVLIDAYGNVVAREMPRRRYEALYGGLPGVESGVESGTDFFPEAPQGSVVDIPVEREALGDITGSIGDDRITPDPDQVLPDAMPSDSMPEGLVTEPSVELPPEQQPDYPILSLKGKSRAEITALQVFLDREGMSPGVIDGKAGSNVSKAVDAWQKMTGETLDVMDTEAILTRLGYTGGLPIIEYTITPSDAAGPFVAAIPEDYGQKAMLPSMAYTSVTEALAERFHMDEAYLKELNPGVDFNQPGTVIKVVNPGDYKKFEVTRIVANKLRKQVFAYDAAGTLVAAYPTSIGSSDTPSPSGIHEVARVALDPNYTYNPKINFQQGENTRVLTIPPGPNGPVGTVWIALSKPTYGIHGTPEPSKIGKSQSHGCIRLTNWDARELAKMVKPGVTVEFID